MTDRDFDAEIEWAKQYGTEQEVHRLTSERDTGSVDPSTIPNQFGITQTGAQVPASEIRPAVRPPVDHVPPQTGDGSNPDLPDPDDDTPVRETDPEVEPYEDWGKKDLQAEAEIRNRVTGANIDHRQNKEPLIAALRADDQTAAASTD